MKNLYHYLSNIEKSRTSLQEGQSIDFVLNEEYSIRTDIVAVDGRDVYVGLDRRAYELLERAGVMEAPIPAAKPNQINLAQSNQNMAGAARPNTPAAAKPLPNSGSSYNQASSSAKPGANAATRAPKPVANTAAKPLPNLGSSYNQAPNSATAPAAVKSTTTRPTAAATTNANVKAANAAFVANQAKAPQGDQTAGGKTNADFLPGAAGGAKPDAMAGADAGNQTSSGYTAQSQAQKTSDAAAPQTNTFGIQPQANIPGSPTGTSAAAPATATSSLPITTTGGPTAANPASVNPATQGGPAVTGGFGQETNITTDSPDQIAKRGPMGTQPQATKSYASVGDFAGAVGNKLKNTFGGGSAPAAPAAPPPATIEEAPRELDRVLQLAGVKRG